VITVRGMDNTTALGFINLTQKFLDGFPGQYMFVAQQVCAALHQWRDGYWAAFIGPNSFVWSSNNQVFLYGYPYVIEFTYNDNEIVFYSR
jgi:hypothetical protein